MIEEPPIIVVVILSIVAMGCVCHGCGRIGIEKQAINRGYATYDNNGCFVWKEQNK